MDPTGRPEAKELFDTVFDLNADGSLSVKEVHRGLKRLGIEVPAEQMPALFNAFDTDNNFRLEPAEFYELYRKQKANPAAQVQLLEQCEEKLLRDDGVDDGERTVLLRDFARKIMEMHRGGAREVKCFVVKFAEKIAKDYHEHLPDVLPSIHALAEDEDDSVAYPIRGYVTCPAAYGTYTY